MGNENLTNKSKVKKVRNICPSSMADSDPRFTTRPFSARTNSNMCRNNYSNYNYMRSVCKLLFFTFFLIAIPYLPSQAPDFINQTIFNKFWELVHLMFIGIAVSYGLFCRRSDDYDNGSSNVDDSVSCVSFIFEDGVSNSMYYSGQGKDGFFNFKNGSFETPFEENVVQAWSSKYFQGEPKVVLEQPNCGIEKYDESESSSFVDYKPLGLPVRSLKSRVLTRVGPEFGNGSSESSGSRVKDSSDSSNDSKSGRFGDLGSEDLEGKFNESDVLDSPIPWRSRSGGTRERVRSYVDRPSHIRPHSVDESQFESLNSRSLRSTVSFSSQVSSQSHSPSSLSPSHSSSSESPKSQMSELVTESSPRRSFPPPSPSVPKPMSSQASVSASHSRSGRTRERVQSNVHLPSHIRPLSVDETQFELLKSRSLLPTVSFSSQVSSQSHSPSSLSPSHSSSSESPKSQMSELVMESSPRRSFPHPSPSVPKPMSSQASVSASHSRSGRTRERVQSNVHLPSHIRPLSVDETQFELLKSRSLLPTVSFSSQVSSQSHSPSSLSPSHSSSSESPKSQMSELVMESSPRRSFPHPSPSVPKPMGSQASVSASHSRSGRTRERVHSNVTHPSHIRPKSVDETQFGALKPRSLRSMVSFSSQVSSQSHSPSDLSPSHSISSESPKSKMSELVKEGSPRRSFPPPSPSVPKPLSSKASVNASHSQQYSDGSLSETPAWECFKDELKEFRDSKNDESSGSKEQISDCFKFDAKPAAPCKASLRGKSVRTFRSFRANSTSSARDAGEKQEDCKKGKLTVGSDKIEKAHTVESETKIEGHYNVSIGFNRRNLGGESHVPKPTSPRNQKREIQDCPENPAAEPGQNSERENDVFEVSSGEETMSGIFNIAGSEVDRKASEFIAKFKEQIRLQRTTSIDSTRGLNITGNYYR